MPLTVSPSDDDVVTALRAFLVDLAPAGVEVFQAQDNRVPEPIGPDFVMTTPLRRVRIATNVDEDTDPLNNVSSIVQSTMLDYQLDIHGPAAGDIAQTVTTLMRDDYAVRFFEREHPLVVPLYASDPRQLVFSGNGEQQYENRWIVEVSLQADIRTTFQQQYADTLAVNLIEVDATFPVS